MLTLIENAEVYAPEPLGARSVLTGGEKILKVGAVDRRALDALGVEYEVIDAAGCVVTPGLIDPHEHLLGGSGEDGPGTQTPMLFLSEIAPHGITTVVGVLGVDTTMKTMAGLLARVKALHEGGLSTRMWTGGYNVPPTTVLHSVREDLLFLDEVIGAGEVAISDARSLQPDARHLAQLVLDTHVGGLLSGKAGVTHFHVGEGSGRLAPLRRLLDDFEVEPGWLYPTHVNRNDALLREAVELARRGVSVDMDTVEGGTGGWVAKYLEWGGPPERLTLSSDSGLGSPAKLYQQVRACVLEHGLPLERVLPLVTANPAAVLKLAGKGRLGAGCDADVLVLRRDSLDVVEVLARGRRLVRGGRLAVRERWLDGSERTIRLTGGKARGGEG